jgi:filamentous hemagglutinin family protein
MGNLTDRGNNKPVSPARRAPGERTVRPGLLSRAVLLTSVSALALLVHALPAEARCIGPCGGVASSAIAAAASAAIGSVQQAAAVTQQSMNSLTRATLAIQAMQAAQSAARAMAQAGPNNLGVDPNHPGQMLPNVPNGLVSGGLVPDSGLAGPGVANPVTSWVGANTPVQVTSGGQTGVIIQQTAPKAILNWTTFNVGKDTTVYFNQSAGNANGGNSWIALNRISDPSGVPSQILGHIQAEGTVYLINRNGIIFGGSSQINVGSLTASSLDIGSGTLAARNQLFLDGLLGPNQQQTGRPQFTFDEVLDSSGNVVTDAFGHPLMAQPAGAVTVQAGAQIATPSYGVGNTDLGRVMLIAPSVLNAGSISTPGGQTVLAGGETVTIAASQSATLRGVTVAVDDPTYDASDPQGNLLHGSALNSGLIETLRGNTTIAASQIAQLGVIHATTAVDANGSVTLGGVFNPQQTVLGGAGVGAYPSSVTLAPNSVIAIGPDDNGATLPSDAASTANFHASQVSIAADYVDVGSGSLTYAPGGTVNVTGGSVYVDSGSTITVAGLTDVVLPMSRNFVTVKLGGNELKDSPLLRGSALYGMTVTVDIRLSGTRADGVSWIGTPLADVSGAIALVGRQVDELMVAGGTVSIAGNQLVMRAGAVVNSSGGYVTYTGGSVATTRLIGSDGRIYDIGHADPNISYVGIAGQFTVDHPHWNVTDTWSNALIAGAHYEPGYIAGYDAGTVAIGGGAVVAEATLLGEAVAGERQRAAGVLGTGNGGTDSSELRALQASVDQMPAAGRVLIDWASSGTMQRLVYDTSSGEYPTNNLVIADAGSALPSNYAPFDALPASVDAAVVLSPAMLAAGGFAQVSATVGGSVTVPAGATLLMRPGGGVGLKGSSIDIGGRIVAPAGAIALATVASVGAAGPLAAPATYNLRLESGAVLDARGLWVNDSGLGSAQVGQAYVNGGSVSLSVPQVHAATTGANPNAPDLTDLSGNIVLDQGSLIDVSSGGRVDTMGRLQTGKDGLPLGRAGSVTVVAAYASLADPTFENYAPYNPTVPLGGRVDLAGTIRGFGFDGGGTLSISSKSLLIGGVPTGQLGEYDLDPTLLRDSGFTNYDFNGFFSATLAADVTLAPRTLTLLPTQSAFVAPTGADVFSFATPVALPDDRRPAASLGIGSDGTTLLDLGSSIVVDPRANVTVKGRDQLTVLGAITAHAGSITLTGAASLNLGSNAQPAFETGKSVWLGADARLDVSGTTVAAYPAALSGAPRRAEAPTSVLAGGAIAIASNDGYIVAESGAVLDVSDAAAIIEQPSNARMTPRTTPLAAWSDAGSITLQASEGMLFAGSFVAHGGAAAAAGGSLTVIAGKTVPRPRLDTTQTDPGTRGSDFPVLPREIVVQQAAVTLPDGLRPGAPIDPGPFPSGSSLAPQPSDPRPLNGKLYVSADQINGSGIDSLTLKTTQEGLSRTGYNVNAIVFTGAVSLSLKRALTLDAPQIAVLPAGQTDVAAAVNAALAGGAVTLSAPYVSIGYSGSNTYSQYGGLSPIYRGAVTAGSGSLTVTGEEIDILGFTTLQQIAEADFVSSGDIRLMPVAAGRYDASGHLITNDGQLVPGEAGWLNTAGSLTFQAAQLYPATGTDFTIKSIGADATITFLSNGSATVPLSAGASLTVSAAHIEQQGTIRAPLGAIQLGVLDASQFSTLDPSESGNFVPTQSVNLDSGSLTSVSADGLMIPFGTTRDQKEWEYAQLSLNPITTPPAKTLDIAGSAIDVRAGSRLDLSGSGDIYATEFVPGTGGSRNVLTQAASGQAVYAIVPGLTGTTTPYDPNFSAGSAPAQGKSIYLSGVPGLPDGNYLLLPGQYATLPGAYRVVVSSQPAPGMVLAKPDGTLIAGGYLTVAGTDIRSALAVTVELQSAAIFNSYSQLAITTGNGYFSQLASEQGAVTPPLPIDAGHLVLQATTSLALQGQVKFNPAAGGRGGEVDIAGRDMAVLGDGGSAPAGYLAIDARGISDLGADSVMIGGIRTPTANGDRVTVLAYNLDVANGPDSALSAPDVILVTRVPLPSDINPDPLPYAGLVLEPGSAVIARGTPATPATRPLLFGDPRNIAQFAPTPDPSNPGGYLSTSSNYQNYLAIAGSGMGALLRVSNAAPGVIVRNNASALTAIAGVTLTDTGATVDFPGIDAGGSLTIKANATIAGANSLVLEATGTSAIDPTASISAAAITVRSSVINIGAAPAGTTGFDLTTTLLGQLATASLTLQSATEIDFYGPQVLGNSTGALTFDAAGLVQKSTGDVSVTARTLVLTDSGAPAQTASGGQGTLALSGQTIEITGGDIAVSGFGSLMLNSLDSVALTGTGSLAMAGDLAISAPSLVAAGGAHQTVSATGALLITAPGGSVAAPDGDQLGGSLSFTAASIELASNLTAIVGTLRLEATTGDIVLDANASIRAPGFNRTYFDVTRSASAGSVSLEADHGNVTLASGATIDVSGVGGDAGDITLAATNGTVTNSATLLGRADPGARGGDLTVLAMDALDLDSWAATANAGGFSDSVTLASKSGDMALSAGHVLISHDVTIVADGGQLTIGGTIDASGAKGGSIQLYGQSATIGGTALLLADATDPTQRGGAVTIGVGTAGVLDLQGGRIDVGGGLVNGIAGGTVTLRVPVVVNGSGLDDAALPEFGTAVTGASSVVLEVYKVFSATNSGDPSQFNGIVDGTSQFFTDTVANFVQNPIDPTSVSRILGSTSGLAPGLVHIRPGVDLVNSDPTVNGGDITIANDLDLAAGSIDGSGNISLTYRFGGSDATRYDGEPGILTLRAIGNVVFNANISDGFVFNGSNYGSFVYASGTNATSAATLMPLVDPGTGTSLGGTWSYRIAAGADTASVDPLALQRPFAFALGQVLAGKGNVELGTGVDLNWATGLPDPVIVRTGTGFISVAAGYDFSITAAGAALYTAGRPSPDLPLGAVQDPNTGIFTIQNPDGFTPANTEFWAEENFTPQVITPALFPEAGGDIRIVAQHNINGIENVTDDPYGSVTGVPNAFIGQVITAWLAHVGALSSSVSPGINSLFGCDTSGSYCGVQSSWWVNFGSFQQGVGALGGGDVRIRAGNDVIDFSASIASNGRVSGALTANSPAVLHVGGGGDLSVLAGGNILSGVYYDAKGNATITARGSIAADFTTIDVFSSTGTKPAVPAATVLALGDTTMRVEAGGAIDIGGVINPTYLPASQALQGTWGYVTYSAASALDVTAASGSVTLNSNTNLSYMLGNGSGTLQFYYGDNQHPIVLPASLSLASLGSDVRVAGAFSMIPSPVGNLDLLAEGSISLYQPPQTTSASAPAATIYMADGDPSAMPTPLNPVTLGLSVSSAIEILTAQRPVDGLAAHLLEHTATPLHEDDPQPIHLYALTGDIRSGDTAVNGQTGAGINTSLNLYVDKQARIDAGRDIIDLVFTGQNLSPLDLTSIAAGRDITSTFVSDPQGGARATDIVLGGPGQLVVAAGRDIGPLAASALPGDNYQVPRGIITVGNALNPYLADNGAAINVAFGIANGVDVAGFAARYLDPSRSIDPQGNVLVTAMDLWFAGNGQPGLTSLTAAQAWSEFQALNPDSQRLVVEQVFFTLLDRSGKEYNDPSSVNYHKYVTGFNAVATLFPAVLGYVGSGQSAALASGSLDMRNSTISTQQGGDISLLGPSGGVQVGSISVPSGQNPAWVGILTLRGGAVSIFANGSVVVDQSRIFTEQGGNLLIWSSNGDINAGKGPKTAAAFPPLVPAFNVDATVTIDPAGLVTGSGIGALLTIPGQPISDVNLIAPRGVVDAGEAGIRAAGNVNIAALSVLHADNITAGGAVTGVPTILAPNSTGLTTASNATAATQQVNVPAAASKADRPSIILVEFVGFGGVDQEDQNGGQQQKDRRGENLEDGLHHYDQTSSVQFLGLGPLSEDEKARLSAAEKHNLKDQAR